MNKRKGFSLKDNELTRNWNISDDVSGGDVRKVVSEDVSDILPIVGEGDIPDELSDEELADFDEDVDSPVRKFRYPSLKPNHKFIVRLVGVAAVVITVVGGLAFFKSGNGVGALTVQAQAETKAVTSEYLASMNTGDEGVLHVDEKKVSDISEKVAGIITDDMLKKAEAGDTDALLAEIESGVAGILKEDPEFTANLSDEDMDTIVNSVSAIVKSELADSVENGSSSITITASSTKNIGEVQEKANSSSDELVGLASRLNETKGEINALSQKIESFVNNQNNVNTSLDNKIEAQGKNGNTGSNGSNGSNGTDGMDAEYLSEIKNLEDRLTQMESDYENLSSDYASAKQSITALQIAASGYADSSDVVAVADSLSEMNSTMQLQLSEIMSQISMLEAKGASAPAAQGGNGSADYDALKSEVGALQKQLQDAADTVGKMMDMPEGSDLSTVLSQYINTVENTSSGLSKDFEDFKAKVLSDERKYDAMYEDYNALLLSYKQSTGSILTLSQILATKGEKKDLEALQQYSYQLYKQVIMNHNTVMQELYGDGYETRDPDSAPTPIGYEVVDENIGNGSTTEGASGAGSSEAAGGESGQPAEQGGNGGSSASNGNGGSTSTNNGTGSSSKAGSKSIRSEITDLKQEAEDTLSDITKMYEEIWGIKPGEQRVSELDNSQLLSDLDAQINSASERLGQLTQSYSGNGTENGTSSTDVAINSNSGSLAQAVSNVVSAYQTADNAIIDALKQETASRQAADKDLGDQIDALAKIVENNSASSTSDTLAIKKAIATYVKSAEEHDAISDGSYIYYDGVGLDGRGFYHVSASVGANEDLAGKVKRTTVADAIKAANNNVGELIRLLEGNEEFAKRYKLK